MLLVALFGVATPAACKKDAAKTTAAADTLDAKPATASGTPLKATRRKPEVVTSASLLRYLPRDSSIVLGVNWDKARASEFVRGFERKLPDVIPELGAIKASCGLDPVTDIESFALSLGKDPKDTRGMVTAIHGNFGREQVEDCIRQSGGTVQGTRYDGTSVFWPTPDTVVFSNGLSSEQLALAPAASAWDNDQLMVLVDEVDLRAEMWGAGMLPPDVAANFGSMGPAPFGVHLTVRIASGMNATLGMEFRTLEDAEAVANMVAMGLQMAKSNADAQGLLDDVSSGVVDQAVVISAQFSAEQLKTIQAMLQKVF
jgi:hypothetical protein